MKLNGFKQKLVVTITTLVICAMVITNWLAVDRFKEDKIASIRSNLMSTATYEAHSIESWLQAKANAIEAMAQHGKTLTNPAEIVALTRLIAKSADLHYATFGFETGKAYSNTGWPNGIAPPDYDPRTRPWYTQARQNNRPSVSDIYKDTITGIPLISITTPISNGVVTGDVSVDILNQVVSSINYPGAVTLILDQQGKVMASSSGQVKTGARLSDTPSLQEVEREILTRPEGIIDYELTGQSKLAFYHEIQLVGNQKWHLMIGLNKEVAYSAVDDFMLDAISLSAVLITITVLLVLWALRWVYQPILHLRDMILKLAEGEGDLTRRLNIHSEDDLGTIAKGVNTFISNLQQMMQEVSSASNGIGKGIEDLRYQSDTTRTILTEHAMQTEQILHATTEMETAAHIVAESSAQAAQTTRQATEDAQLSHNVVSGAVEDVVALLHGVETMSTHIATVDADTQQIHDVLSVIGEIAEQTNLLALNAAIEAARAGEQGRGFAVVADEVRALAARTQQSTAEIGDVLEKLRTGSEHIVQSMTETRQRGETSRETSAKALESLTYVQQSVEGINDINTRIATSAEEQSAATAQIGGTMTAINDMVGELSGNTDTTVDSAQRLMELNQQLQQIVNRFRLA
ncbi:MAG: methyl-accepting chemotaxis protein [Marinobacterium sp.]|nr:methyl-accepting chemotaxis protein [Marinobacterium sp.]